MPNYAHTSFTGTCTESGFTLLNHITPRHSNLSLEDCDGKKAQPSYVTFLLRIRVEKCKQDT